MASVSNFMLLSFMFFLFFLSPSNYTCVATDTLRPGQNFSDGQTLISSNNRFELRFFSLGNSSSRYLGICYYNLPLTVVWVANRNNPIFDSSGRLIMDSNGTLILQNSSMGIVWSTYETVPGSRNLVLQLLGSGNLVVRSEESVGDDYVWQSFDYISDTLLPGMKLGWKLRSRTNRFMRSWRSNQDPSDGDYTFSLDPPETPQLYLRDGWEKKYRWGPFDSDRFSGSNELRSNTVFRPMFNATPDEVFYSYELLDDSTLSRFVVTQAGLIQYYTWRNHSNEWNLMITINRDYCDNYGMCGGYGNCYQSDPNYCRCLDGFTPRSPQDWRLVIFAGGCRREHELNCSNRDGFIRYSGIKLPDNPVVWPNLSHEGCRLECERNCECMAYTAINPHGNGSQCVVWFGELVDIRYFPERGQEIYIRMARAELDAIAAANRRKELVIIVSIVVSTVTVILLLVGVTYYIYHAKRTNQNRKTADQQNNGKQIIDQEENRDQDVDFPTFPLDTISAATNEFSPQNKIGQGGFGPVFQGVLDNGVEIAVKRLSRESGQGIREFKNEVILISKLQHRNLVKLLGCCIQGDEKMLVYEYLPNKSLDNFLHDEHKKELLPWTKRFDVILGIARGLLYLHQDSRLRIIHRDLKTSNILLDSDMNPKISDFGIARIFGGEQTEERTRRVMGTYGYMSPEYAMHGNFSVKSDVFSFGVIVLEIISGKKNWGFYHPDHNYNLIGHAWKLWNEENPLELMDNILDESFSVKEVIRCIHVALLCLQQKPEDRPPMFSVVFLLSNENAELPEPKEPGFCTETSYKVDSSSWSGQHSITANEITITVMDGR